MSSGRLWPVLTGLVGLLSGATWLEFASAGHTLAAEVIRIETTDDESDEEQSGSDRWYTAAPINKNHLRSRVLARRGEYEEALTLLHKLREESPKNALLLAESGHWARRFGKDQEALALLEQAQELLPKDPTISLDRGLALAGVGQKAKALDAFDAALQERPAHTPTRIVYGKALLAQNRFDDASRILKPAAEHGSNEERARALVVLGQVNVLAGRPERARPLLREAIERAPSSPNIWIRSGRALLNSSRKEDHEAATEYLVKGIALAPHSTDARSLLGQVYERRGMEDEALDAYLDCLRIDAARVFARKRALRLQLERENYKDARRHAAYLLTNRELEPDSHFLAGLTEYRAREFDASRKHYQQAITTKGGKYPEAWFNLGLLERADGRPKAAVVAYETAISEKKDYRAAWNNLGLVYSELGDNDKAEEAFRQALRLSKNYASAWSNLARHLSNLNEHAGAVEAYQHVVKLDPKDKSASLALGVALRKAGRPKEAVGVYRSLVKTFPRYLRAWYNLAIALSAAGDDAAAEKAYQTALSLDPNHRSSLKNLGLLEARRGNSDQARAHLIEALEQEPRDDEVRLKLAELHQKLGARSECAGEVRRVLANDPSNLEAQNLLPQCK